MKVPNNQYYYRVRNSATQHINNEEVVTIINMIDYRQLMGIISIILPRNDTRLCTHTMIERYYVGTFLIS